MGRAFICLLLPLALAACGGGSSTNSGTNAGSGNAANQTPPAGNGAKSNTGDDGKVDPPKEDPDAYRKVRIPAPAGWHKLSKGEQKEFYKAEVLKDPGSDYPMLAAYADLEPPHSSSGTDADWKAWREDASILLVFNVSKKGEDAKAMLKQHGAKFLQGFNAEDVHTDEGNAVYAHLDDPHKWMAGVSNTRGTYVVVALIRGEEAGNKIVVYPNEIKPE